MNGNLQLVTLQENKMPWIFYRWKMKEVDRRFSNLTENLKQSLILLTRGCEAERESSKLWLIKKTSFVVPEGRLNFLSTVSRKGWQ